MIDDILQMLRIEAGWKTAPAAGLVYTGLAQFLLQHARPWPVATDQRVGRFLCLPNSCFANAYRLANARKRLRYVEGYAMGVIPVHHAWVVNEAEEVLDPTWDRYSTIGTAYVGVEIPLPIVRAIQHRQNQSVLMNWQRGYPLFRQPWNEEAKTGRRWE